MQEEEENILHLIKNKCYNYDRPSNIILKEFGQILLYLYRMIKQGVDR